MKAACLALSVSRRAGGMLDCVRRPAQEMQRSENVTVDVLSVTDDQTERDKASWEPLPLHLFSSRGPGNLAFAPAIGTCLQEIDPDLVHTFGLWTYLSRITLQWNRRSHRPYLVTPQGMLDPWALGNSYWRKRVAGLLYEHRHLRDAACLHATGEAELAAFRAYGLRNPVCIIPNGVDLPSEHEPPACEPPWATAIPADRRVLLYLGRLHPKKGLPSLLRAWSALQKTSENPADGWSLVVAGWDQGGHLAELQALAVDLGLEGSVSFTGPLYGAEKAAAYQHAVALVLPSLSEGLPLVILEAWSHRLPVVMTAACNLPEGFAAGAALESSSDPEELAATLTRLFLMSDSDRRQMGERGRTLVENRFTWSSAASQLAQIYRWVLGKGPRPDCVFG